MSRNGNESRNKVHTCWSPQWLRLWPAIPLVCLHCLRSFHTYAPFAFKDLHGAPVQRMYKISSNTFSGSMRFLPLVWVSNDSWTCKRIILLSRVSIDATK